MNRLIAMVRELLHGSDRERALREERALVAEEIQRSSDVSNRLRARFSSNAAQAVTLGASVEGGWPVRIDVHDLLAHIGMTGPSGAGKSWFLVILLLALLRNGTRFAALDPKPDVVEILKRAVVDVASELPRPDAERLLQLVVLLDPFSGELLPNLGVLARDPSLDPELQAYEIASVITAEMEMSAGFRQEAVLHRLLECLIRANLPLTAVPAALHRPALLTALADSCAPRELFLDTATRLEGESKDRLAGLSARLDRLLRLRSARLALGSPSCIDFGQLLDERITLVRLAPPLGSSDVGRFLSGLIWLKLSHAIRRRPNGAAPVQVAVDEWPTFLAGGGARLASGFEDLLRLARSKGVFLWVLAQDLSSIAKISPSLPEVAKTNLHWQLVFRAVDAGAWDFILPVTGRRRRPASLPWEEAKELYLERGAELVLLREELARLPDRQCYIVDRRTGLPGVLIRTADLRLRASEADVRALEVRASRSEFVAAVSDLEVRQAEIRATIARLLGNDPPDHDSPTAALWRGTRDSEFG